MWKIGEESREEHLGLVLVTSVYILLLIILIWNRIIRVSLVDRRGMGVRVGLIVDLQRVVSLILGKKKIIGFVRNVGSVSIGFWENGRQKRMVQNGLSVRK
jgi:hypothetical protein